MLMTQASQKMHLMYIAEFMCEESVFGFSLREGAEYGHSSLYVLKIAPGDAAERDGRLRVSVGEKCGEGKGNGC